MAKQSSSEAAMAVATLGMGGSGGNDGDDKPEKNSGGGRGSGGSGGSGGGGGDDRDVDMEVAIEVKIYMDVAQSDESGLVYVDENGEQMEYIMKRIVGVNRPKKESDGAKELGGGTLPL